MGGCWLDSAMNAMLRSCMEIDITQHHGAIARGVPVIQADLDEGLHDIPDQAFDYVVLSQTLQQVLHPKQLLEEMVRVAHQALVVVPTLETGVSVCRS